MQLLKTIEIVYYIQNIFGDQWTWTLVPMKLTKLRKFHHNLTCKTTLLQAGTKSYQDARCFCFFTNVDHDRRSQSFTWPQKRSRIHHQSIGSFCPENAASAFVNMSKCPEIRRVVSSEDNVAESFWSAVFPGTACVSDPPRRGVGHKDVDTWGGNRSSSPLQGHKDTRMWTPEEGIVPALLFISSSVSATKARWLEPGTGRVSGRPKIRSPITSTISPCKKKRDK